MGAVSATTPMWLSRDAWVDGVRAWAASPDFVAVCASVRVSIASATVVAIAVLWAEPADHATGRYAAITRERIAAKLGCSSKTVTRAWKVLGAAGWAVEAARGHGCSSGHTAGNRPSIWHLVSRRPAAPVAADSGENVHLPPKAGSCSLPFVENNSPSVRMRARGHVSPHDQTPQPPRPRRRWRATPRPLPVQRLAGQLAARAHGLDRGHIGAVCDAITTAGIDPAAWTARQLGDALNADMRATGWSWPDRIERPGAFLAARLRRLPARPDITTPVDGGTAAGPENTAQPRPEFSLTAAQRARITAAQDEFRRQTAQRRSRASVQPVTRACTETAPRSSAVPTASAAGVCVVCRAGGAPRRPYLPVHRAHVCDDCWDSA
ncbi:rep protein [Mycolicibacterium goodii]|uniref:rep protein n=1 Tax=Mycolicibacterium goodii TaxID=134601 RepID=UPI001BDCE178|nr:rep protein [Mycolicibacterium goodii]MBU8834472.1 rep protein [Mycolicibacterium goodii]